jgi:MoaA/NifB/PqqE/SkfB family radical SAM enzyme
MLDLAKKYIKQIPRLPLEGKIDLTYRCNNNCRHCWLRISADAKEKDNELSFEEIKDIVNQARQLGTRVWFISGGEPMLRPDFAEIFDYITNRCVSYSLNTNGTLITPQIAQLLKKKGTKMVALYGATAQTHDHITRNPGSFEATMRGFTYLKEAGAGFIVQLIPMQDNYHQFDKMIELAQALSRHYRIGAPWLYLSAYWDVKVNAEIKRQRLAPEEVIALDKPDVSYEENMERETGCNAGISGSDRIFAACITNRRDFHIDSYGAMSFCSFIKDSKLRYSLRKGSVEEGWEKFIPSLADKVCGNKEYLEGCAACANRKNCRWCPVYAYLEHKDYSKKIDYLCAAAKENQKYKENWKKNHRAYYQIGAITIQVESDLPIEEDTFHPKINVFKVNGPGNDNVLVRHHFSLPDLQSKDLGERIYSKAPWSIYKKGDSWIYLGISPTKGEKDLHRVAVSSRDHSRIEIYHKNDDAYRKGGLHSLTMFSTDQILIARLLADRQGCYIHSCGIMLGGRGLLFVGHSEAGKSTISLILKEHGGQILCDDRIIIRKYPENFKIYGTWSHGDVSDVSNDSALLSGIFFLEQSKENLIIPLKDKKEIIKKLLACLIKPLETADWREKEFVLLEQITQGIPCYRLQFDKSGKIARELQAITHNL